jgi:hypothetical protein
MAEMTTSPVKSGDTSGLLPEFGRWQDVQRLFGIKRGTLYNLIKAGQVKSCLLRVKGTKSGVRLVHLASVRQMIMEQMAA